VPTPQGATAGAPVATATAAPGGASDSGTVSIDGTLMDVRSMARSAREARAALQAESTKRAEAEVRPD
jgi:hypothetical protein